MAATILYNTNISHMRPLNVREDLSAVADLIELCFSHQMDADGRDYIRHLRQASQDFHYLRWMPGAAERVSIPLHGYIWEEDGKLVGNLTLIPFFWSGKWLYLIANVAVHPDYRKRGIARLLTQRALDHIRDHGADAAWLQVRDDNPVAHNLYLSLGFLERARRTTWESIDPVTGLPDTPESVYITPRNDRDWNTQAAWLQKLYPPEVAWNLPFDYNRYSPSLLRSLFRMFSSDPVKQWCARISDEIIGFATWEPSRSYADPIWLATTPKWQDLALRVLLPHVRKSIFTSHSLIINYPDGQAEEAFYQCGFTPRNTLIWMEARFDGKVQHISIDR
jgi:GNAT superfamily N-acetyltransferase